MLKYFYKVALIATFGILNFQKSFSQCSTKTDLQLSINSPVCFGNTAIVTIKKSEIGVAYQAFEGTVAVSANVVGSGSDLTIEINTLSSGSHAITIKATGVSCAGVELVDKPILEVNQPPRTDQRVVGRSYCLGSPTTSIVIYGTRPGEVYEPYLGPVAIGSPVTSVTDTVLLTIPTSALQNGLNQIVITASIPGCAKVILDNKAIVVASPAVDYFFSVSGDIICSNNPTAKITITGSGSNIQYQMYLGTEELLDSFYGDAGTNTTVKNIPTSLLPIGRNVITVKATVNTTCQTLVLSQNTEIIVNPVLVFDALILIGDTVTLPASFATITVVNPIQGVKYRALKAGAQIGDSVIATTQNPIKLKIPVGPPDGLAVGTHDFTVLFTTFGCEAKTVTAKTTIVVKPEIITSIDDKLVNSNFAIWPNPFSSDIHVSSKLKGQLKLQIMDATGNIVHQESFSNSQDLKINPDLKGGLYFLQIESEGSRETVKLIKQ